MALLKVGSDEWGIVYTTKGVAYRREKKKTVRVGETAVNPPTPPPSPSAKSLVELLGTDDTGQLLFKHKDEVAALGYDHI